jgi:hypothetical protein
MPEEAVTRSLVVLVNSDAAILQRALRLLEPSGSPAHARRRLVNAELLLGEGDGIPPEHRPKSLS